MLNKDPNTKEAKSIQNMRYIKESDWRSVPGEFFIWVFIPYSDKSDVVKKRVGCQKGYSFPSIAIPSKPPVSLTHYTRTATNRPRTRQVYEPEILADVQKFKENLGYVKSVAPDETQTVVKKPKQISDLWKIYREQDLEKRVNLKTFDEKLNKDTIQSHQNS